MFRSFWRFKMLPPMSREDVILTTAKQIFQEDKLLPQTSSQESVYSRSALVVGVGANIQQTVNELKCPSLSSLV
ncbi:uncharacterized protein ColSpa_07812 [Colletotrichum spaethianum]|uniref:Uncharacterized protein n=1 Tax=Colletotrichum spaethianum TaxID=700344 RepID=A0AA37P8J9_9PEZI|nr:uncharacterized protein ColSpa_07812 [Colletotrichum spaethianum]GKT47631.1 hypothetical protein ColSpa_07812 [Colletotrichum spaethianum]